MGNPRGEQRQHLRGAIAWPAGCLMDIRSANLFAPEIDSFANLLELEPIHEARAALIEDISRRPKHLSKSGRHFSNADEPDFATLLVFCLSFHAGRANMPAL